MAETSHDREGDLRVPRAVLQTVAAAIALGVMTAASSWMVDHRVANHPTLVELLARVQSQDQQVRAVQRTLERLDERSLWIQRALGAGPTPAPAPPAAPPTPTPARPGGAP